MIKFLVFSKIPKDLLKILVEFDMIVQILTIRRMEIQEAELIISYKIDASHRKWRYIFHGYIK